MNLIRCEKGHFYDGDKFAQCPHCAPNEDDREVTIALHSENGTETRNTEHPFQSNNNATLSLKDALVASRDSVMDVADNDDDEMGKTVRFYDNEEGIEPCVGWLVGLNGAIKGESFLLKSGKNFIGRGSDMDVVLSKDNSVSRNKHAILIYEPKSRMFIAQPGESRELFYLNGNVVLNNEQMKKNDILSIGETKLMLIPCCDEQFCWEDVADET